MLGKLFKNEFAKTWKIAVLSFGCSVLMSILVTVLLAIENSLGESAQLKSTGEYIFDSLLNVLAVVGFISIAVIPVAFFVYLCIHFYKTMYSTQGYLTHTLPASPVASFNVKLLVSVIWTIAGIAVMLITALTIGLICSGASLTELFGKEAREAISEGLRIINNELYPMFGVKFGDIIWLMVVSVVISIFSAYLFIFTALTIGQLSNTHKIGLAIGVGVGMSFAEKIIGGIFAVVITAKLFLTDRGVNFDSVNFGPESADFKGFFGGVMWTSFDLAIAMCLIQYVIDILIVRKHINLE